MKNSKTLVEGKYYRVYPITKVTGWHPVTTETEPISRGLAIEEKCGDHYFVVAFIRPGQDGPVFKDVSFRSVNTLDPTNIEKLDEYLNCVDFAKNVLNDIKEAEEEREY